ncbi:hypothetical protein TWF225_006652 [Orbilia oligospora]|uniref:Uncharacterized protein n=1 Tax=Orbilia oligospora TaxID=2813651 RepID=A0A7C8K940_ORBOL|nr:hypothetical protein TWF751_007961 [Orbilia oligospora]KAF3181613.1 hypothetical protein TWF225_006652 [Orbilia oligospora]KAF3253286.1 hypothetical protein TWF217_007544 [Orbilia oligospora]KAF3255138.1 hypothetical protein TWF128_005942 [Orbilia oligospora]KAF3298305.1 hypothetical protein TWF132_000133 [Orbilia oligospora]
MVPLSYSDTAACIPDLRVEEKCGEFESNRFFATVLGHLKSLTKPHPIIREQAGNAVQIEFPEFTSSFREIAANSLTTTKDFRPNSLYNIFAIAPMARNTIFSRSKSRVKNLILGLTCQKKPKSRLFGRKARIFYAFDSKPAAIPKLHSWT